MASEPKKDDTQELRRLLACNAELLAAVQENMDKINQLLGKKGPPPPNKPGPVKPDRDSSA